MMKKLFALLLLALLFVGCSDYEQMLEDDYGFLRASATDPSQGNSSTTTPSTTPSNVVYGSLADSRDGQVYKTVVIGSQVWMAENLNFNPPNYPTQTFCYKDDIGNCAVYGRLYTWSAAMDSLGRYSKGCVGCGRGVLTTTSGNVRGICPESWHVPRMDEWQTLLEFVGGASVAGDALRSTALGGSDVYGFSILAAGFYSDLNGASFSQLGNSTGFWTSTDSHAWNSRSITVVSENPSITTTGVQKNFARSIRCLKD